MADNISQCFIPKYMVAVPQAQSGYLWLYLRVYLDICDDQGNSYMYILTVSKHLNICDLSQGDIWISLTMLTAHAE